MNNPTDTNQVERIEPDMSKEEHEKELSEVYDSGCSDTAKHLLALFEGELTEQMKKWLRLEIAERSKF